MNMFNCLVKIIDQIGNQIVKINI